jgi:hypothetical protein
LTEEIKRNVAASTQEAKKAVKMNGLATRTGQYVGIEPVSSLREHALATAASATVTPAKAPAATYQLAPSKPNKKYKQPGLATLGITSMTEAEADEILMPHVIATVKRREALDRMIDPFFQAALIKSHPAIKSHLPLTVQTIYQKYVLRIDKMAREELVEYMKRLPGDINVSFDGVTINRKSKQVYTIARGHMTVFDTFTDLGSDKHNSAAEVADAVKVRAQDATHIFCHV